MISKDEIDRLCREHDQWIERAKDEAERLNAQRSCLKGELVFKDNEDALVSRTAPATYDADNDYVPTHFTEQQADAIGYALHLMRAEALEEREQAIAPLEREIAFLRGQLDAVLKMGGISPAKPRERKSSADVIDLPNWRRRNVA